MVNHTLDRFVGEVSRPFFIKKSSGLHWSLASAGKKTLFLEAGGLNQLHFFPFPRPCNSIKEHFIARGFAPEDKKAPVTFIINQDTVARILRLPKHWTHFFFPTACASHGIQLHNSFSRISTRIHAILLPTG